MLFNADQHFPILKRDLEDADVVRAVPLARHLYAVLHLRYELVDFLPLKEVKPVRKVNYPSVGMVGGKSGKNFDGLVVVGECVFGIVEHSQVFVQIGVADGIGNVELSNLLFANADSFGEIFFEGDSLSHADEDGCLFLVYGCQNGLAVHVLHLQFCDFLGDLQFLEGEVVLELPVEDLHPLDADVHVVRMVHEDVVVLLRVHLHQRVL